MSAPKPYIIAIDGPAGAGKSTIAKGVAKTLNLTRVDTGAIYRSLALLALEQGQSEEAALLPLLEVVQTGLRFEGTRLFIEEREVTNQIRAPEVSALTSRISAFPKVRAGLLQTQRSLARADPRGAVLEGRDIGTVVFPDAEIKVFLTASAEERARRRTKELESAGTPAVYEEVLAAIQQRDAQDSGRAVAPLKQAEDAYPLDSTSKSIEEVVQEIASLVQSRGYG